MFNFIGIPHRFESNEKESFKDLKMILSFLYYRLTDAVVAKSEYQNKPHMNSRDAR